MAAILGTAPREAAAQAAVVCIDCTKEPNEIVREARRVAEFAKHLAVVRENLEYQRRLWASLFYARDYGSTLRALGGLTNRYYPEGADVVGLTQTGRSPSHRPLFDRHAMGRIERGLGNGAEAIEEFERKRTLNDTARTMVVTAIRGTQQSIVEVERAARGLDGQTGQANIGAAQNALQAANARMTGNAQQASLLLGLIREEREAERLREEEFGRLQARRHAAELAAHGSGRLARVHN